MPTDRFELSACRGYLATPFHLARKFSRINRHSDDYRSGSRREFRHSCARGSHCTPWRKNMAFRPGPSPDYTGRSDGVGASSVFDQMSMSDMLHKLRFCRVCAIMPTKGAQTACLGKISRFQVNSQAPVPKLEQRCRALLRTWDKILDTRGIRMIAGSDPGGCEQEKISGVAG